MLNGRCYGLAELLVGRLEVIQRNFDAGVIVLCQEDVTLAALGAEGLNPEDLVEGTLNPLPIPTAGAGHGDGDFLPVAGVQAQTVDLPLQTIHFLKQAVDIGHVLDQGRNLLGGMLGHVLETANILDLLTELVVHLDLGRFDF